MAEQQEIRVYRVEVRGETYVCPICGPLADAVMRGHGPEHVVVIEESS